MRKCKVAVSIAAAGAVIAYKGVAHANEWVRFQRSPAKYRGYR